MPLKTAAFAALIAAIAAGTPALAGQTGHLAPVIAPHAAPLSAAPLHWAVARHGQYKSRGFFRGHGLRKGFGLRSYRSYRYGRFGHRRGFRGKPVKKFIFK